MKQPLRLGIFSGILILTMSLTNTGFKDQQRKYQRVRGAYEDKGSQIEKWLKDKGVAGDFELYLRAFKQDDVIEAWVRPEGKDQFVHLKDFEVCAKSGESGPKRKQGDLQVPEGFYHIDRFNPVSNFHLSLGLNYPNRSDKVWSRGLNPGGDIFIHGSCVTVGCLPITDDKIRELYLLCVEAKNRGQNTIPVTVFPRKFKTSGDVEDTPGDKYKGLWRALAKGQRVFDQTKQLPTIGFNADGTYSVK